MSSAVPERADVVVLGAGPAGLATAWYAARRDLRVVVVERADRVGGLAGSLVVDGCVVDLGSHRLHPSVRADLLADLVGPLGVDLVWRPRNGRIRLGGRWLAFPLRPADLLRHSPPGFGSRMVLDVLSAQFRKRATAAGIPFNPAFAGAYDFTASPDFGELMRQFIADIPDGGLVMCHPGFVDDTLRSLDPLTTQREAEHAYLAGDQFPPLLAANNVTLG